MLDLVTGELFLRRCRSLRCPYCLRIEAQQRAGAVALARPTHMLTLTRTGAEFAGIRDRVNRWREYCRRLELQFEWFWVAERNPAGTGTHVHAWVRSVNPLPPVTLAEAARRVAGLGSVVDLDEVRGPMGLVGTKLEGVGRAGYVLKEAVGTVSGEGLSEPQEAFLNLNGGRLGHSSRGFWLDRAGRPVGSVRRAVQEANRLRRGSRTAGLSPSQSRHRAGAR